MDSSEKQRTETLNMIKNVMKDFLSYPLVFLWSQGGDQYDFESQFPLGAGYPSLLTVIPKKKKYSVMRTGQGFGAENIKSYINSLLAGRETAGDLPAVLNTMRKVDPWKVVTK
jgi:protein disulfide-isomerase A6